MVDTLLIISLFLLASLLFVSFMSLFSFVTDINGYFEIPTISPFINLTKISNPLFIRHLRVMLNLMEEVPHILNTVYLIRVINKPHQFYSYRTIWKYEPDQYRKPFSINFLVLSILLKPYRQ